MSDEPNNRQTGTTGPSAAPPGAPLAAAAGAAPTTPAPVSPALLPNNPTTAAAGAANTPTNEAAMASAHPAAPSLRDLLDRMERLRPLIANDDPALARTMQGLAQHRADPERMAQPMFRTNVAYALQDMEKTPIGRIEIANDVRAEMTQLASTAPGLENERMQALLRTTGAIHDKHLVQEIRIAGGRVGQFADQSTPEIQSRIDALENQVRLSQRPPEAGPAPAVPPGPQSSGQAQQLHAETTAPAAQPTVVRQQGVFNILMRGLRPSEPSGGAPWEPPHTPMGPRISAFEKDIQDRSDAQALQRMEKSGRATLDAMQAFSAGEGAIVMNRIRAAAQSNPGGMEGVLSEMREGGRFADLRKEFNTALSHERGATSAYDKAAASLAQYGQQRPEIDQILARRPDAANLNAKFQRLDAEIGEAASSTPSRRDGMAMIDDLTKRAGELLHSAIEGIKAAFTCQPSADTRASPSPSPSP